MVTVVLTAPTVTVPEIAGSEPMVTLFPTVTLAIEIGWVAGKLATVTVPVMAGSEPTVTVPEMAGREPMVTELPTVTLPICAVLAPRVTVPAPIVTTPMRFVPAGSGSDRDALTTVLESPKEIGSL